MKKTIIKTTVALVCFIVWTIVVCFCDRQMDPNGHLIGLATMNLAISKWIGTERNVGLATGADILLILALVALFGCLLIGAVKIIKTKSLKSVHPLFYGTIVVGVFWAICYLMFDKVGIVNYSPVLINGTYKSSYPSTHVVCAVFCLGGLLRHAKDHTSEKKYIIPFYALYVLFVAGMAALKLFANDHYFSDIIGAVILGICYLYLIDLWVACFEARNRRNDLKEIE